MSPRRRRPAAPPPRPASRPAEMHPVLVGAIVLAAVVIGVWLVRANRGSTGRITNDDAVLAESLRVADARRDWVTALGLAETLGRRRPNDSFVLLARARAWNNYAVGQRTSQTLVRPALRTSLERTDCLRRAMALSDSASMAAGDGAHWVAAIKNLAGVEEWLGLPGDALLAQESIKERAPGDVESAFRVYWLRAVLYDPVHPDTSAYHERMKGLARR